MEDRRAMFDIIFPASSDRVPLSIPGEAEINAKFPCSDVQIITSDGQIIPAHSSVLALVSPVLEKRILLDIPPQRRGSSEKTIPIPGVPFNAVLAFVRFLYSSRWTEDEMENYGMHLLVLSHVFQVAGLKRACAAALARQLTVDKVVDLLQLARECDAPSLFVHCMKLVAGDFRAVEQTEGWRFLQAHDPWLEIDLLQYLQEAELREKRRRGNRKAQSIYQQLSEAMECLQHICTEGCTYVGPHDRDQSSRSRKPCGRSSTCQGLQDLIRHFAGCRKKTAEPGGCSRCKRMWQLLRLHSSICNQPGPCKVPLCKQFKITAQQLEKKGVDERWRLLVRKVVSARVMCSLSKLKREEELHRTWIRVTHKEKNGKKWKKNENKRGNLKMELVEETMNGSAYGWIEMD